MFGTLRPILTGRRATRGNVITEFALLAPVAMFGLVGVVDFGRVVYDDMRLAGATRAGAQYAFRNSNDSAGIRQVILDVLGADGGSVTVAATQFCECASDNAAVVCGNACPDRSPTAVFMRVTAQRHLTPIMAYPGFPNPIPLSSESVVRVR